MCFRLKFLRSASGAKTSRCLVNYFVACLSRRMPEAHRIDTETSNGRAGERPSAWKYRELENFIERCVILSQNDELTVPLDELARKCVTRRTAMPPSTFHDAERQAIIDALKASSGKIAGHGGAAERLELKHMLLLNKMRRLNMTRQDYSQ